MVFTDANGVLNISDSDSPDEEDKEEEEDDKKQEAQRGEQHQASVVSSAQAGVNGGSRAGAFAGTKGGGKGKEGSGDCPAAETGRRESMSTRCGLDAKSAKSIVGAKDKFSKVSGAHLTIEKKTVVIRGTEKQRSMARLCIDILVCQIKKRPLPDNLEVRFRQVDLAGDQGFNTLDIDVQSIGYLTSKNGAILGGIEQEHGILLFLVVATDASSRLIIVGTADARAKARASCQKLLRSESALGREGRGDERGGIRAAGTLPRALLPQQAGHTRVPLSDVPANSDSVVDTKQAAMNQQDKVSRMQTNTLHTSLPASSAPSSTNQGISGHAAPRPVHEECSAAAGSSSKTLWGPSSKSTDLDVFLKGDVDSPTSKLEEIKSELKTEKTENMRLNSALHERSCALENKNLVLESNLKSLSAAKAKCAELEAQLSDMVGKFDSTNRSLSISTSKFAELETKLEHATTKCLDFEAKNALLFTDKDENALKIAEHTKSIEKKDERLAKLESELKAERVQAMRQQEMIARLKTEAKDFNTQKKAFDASMLGCDAELKEKEKRVLDAEKSLRDADLRREAVQKKNNNDIIAKDRELQRLEAAVKDKADNINRLHNKNKDLESQLSTANTTSKRREEEWQSVGARKAKIDQLEAEMQKKDGRIKQLNASVRDQEKDLASTKEELDAKASLVSAMKDQIKKLEADIKIFKSDKQKEPVKRVVPRPDERQLVFGACYSFGRGGPHKTHTPGRECNALPYDDAFGSTNNCLILCDGVGGGGAASGRWARECVEVCLRAASKAPRMLVQPLPVPGQPPKQTNMAAEIVRVGMKEAAGNDRRKDSRATTTLVVLKLVAGVDETGAANSRIDAVEIGDSRWALLTFDAKTNKYKCSYLAEAHMHIDRDTLAPFQVAAPKADFGKSPEYYFNERDHQKKVLRSLPISEGANVMVVAGSDGLWDNFMGDKAPVGEAEVSNILRQTLEDSVNEFASEMGPDDKNLLGAYGNYLKNTVVNRMASDGGKSDDLSIFVGKVEQTKGPVGPDVLDTRFFDGRMPNEAIQRGVAHEAKFKQAQNQGSPRVVDALSSSRPPLAHVSAHPNADGRPVPDSELGKRKGPAPLKGPADPRPAARQRVP